MAKAKPKHPIRDGSYGKIVKRLSNNMFETSKGHRIPPFTGYKIGDDVVIKEGNYVVGDGTDTSVDNDNSEVSVEEFKQMQKDMSELKAKNEALEAKVGKKGGAIKGAEADETK